MIELRSAAQMVCEAKRHIQNLTAEQAAAELAAGALLVDLRETEERRRDGVIPEALHAPRGMLEYYADPSSPSHRVEFEPERRILLLCASGGRSALAADLLQRMGYRNVAHLEGGLRAWKEQGRAVQTLA